MPAARPARPLHPARPGLLLDDVVRALTAEGVTVGVEPLGGRRHQLRAEMAPDDAVRVLRAAGAQDVTVTAGPTADAQFVCFGDFEIVVWQGDGR